MAKPYKKILFIEDEIDTAEIYSLIMNRSGLEVVCRYNGATGLAEAQTGSYDLILLDLMLPIISGMEVLKTLRDPKQSPTFDQTTDIIILTNFEESDPVKRQLLQLAKAYLIKVDLTPRRLVAELQTIGAAQ